LHTHQEEVSNLPMGKDGFIRAMVTSGASCPDALVERVIYQLATLTGNADALPELTQTWENGLI
jgi:4-hydroxy-3-methylbut-2-enyl diphosphate reductase IspH